MDDASDSSLDQLCAELQERLDQACRRARIEEACIGVSNDAVEWRAFVRPSSCRAKPFCIDVGCLAKVLTATLISQLVCRGRLVLEDTVAHLLPLRRNMDRRVFRQITIGQLLNHTHGLDGTSVRKIPLLMTGYVDTDTLCNRLCSVPRIARPGALYNYGTAGAYMAAAILEHMYGRLYEDVLIEHLLQPIGAMLRYGESAALLHAQEIPQLCPASGGRMALSLDELMAFVRSNFGDERAGENALQRAPSRFMFESIVPLSGWNPLEHGVAIGWKHYGPGWFGHHANVLDCSVLVRLHLRRRLAVIVAVRGLKGEAAFQVFATLFGDVLRELVPTCVPALLTPQEWSALDADQFTGTYENSGSSVTIERRGGSLEMAASYLHSGKVAPMVSLLMPAQRGIFLTGSAVRELFPLLQFICQSDGRFQYIWNGSNVWGLKKSAS